MSQSKASTVFPFGDTFPKNRKIFSSCNGPGCFEGMVQSYTPDVGLVLTMIFQVNVNVFFWCDFIGGRGFKRCKKCGTMFSWRCFKIFQDLSNGKKVAYFLGRHSVCHGIEVLSWEALAVNITILDVHGLPCFGTGMCGQPITSWHIWYPSLAEEKSVDVTRRLGLTSSRNSRIKVSETWWVTARNESFIQSFQWFHRHQDLWSVVYWFGPCIAGMYSTHSGCKGPWRRSSCSGDKFAATAVGLRKVWDVQSSCLSLRKVQPPQICETLNLLEDTTRCFQPTLSIFWFDTLTLPISLT